MENYQDQNNIPAEAPRENPEQNAFIREIKEEIQKDKAAALWEKWKYWIIGVSSIAIIATASHSFGKYRTARDAAKFAPLYEEALFAPTAEARIEALTRVAKGSRRAFRDMAYQQLFAAQMAAGRYAAAADTLKSAFDNAVNPEFRSLSAIKLSQLESFIATEAGFNDAVKRLGQIKRSAPLYCSTQVALASLQASRNQNEAAVKTIDSSKCANNATTSIRAFANAIRSAASAKE
ncbi:MAG: tetratricopeptide repeat protein [Alphaproteobacteria bacterium]|nr:tetratricopeptide repeat protein [Alphaproteobacteria bacterium]